MYGVRGKRLKAEAKSQLASPSLVSLPCQEVLPQVSLPSCFSSSRMGQTRVISMTPWLFPALTSTLGFSAALGVGKKILAYDQSTGSQR